MNRYVPIRIVCPYDFVHSNSYILYDVGYKFVHLNSYNFNVMLTNSYHKFNMFLYIRSILLLNLGDNWQDVKDAHGGCLIIDEFHFARKEVEGFTASNECRYVFAAMELSVKLLLEDHSVHDTYSNISDSMMKLIKMTSAPGPTDAPINNASFGRVNKKFIRFFIDMLSLQLVFDNWYVSIHT
jgi:hypothetical protein